MYIINHFRNKILCSQRNGHTIQILGRIPWKKGLKSGDFWFVRRKHHARVRSVFFQVKPWCWKTYHISGIGGHIWPNRFCTWNCI